MQAAVAVTLARRVRLPGPVGYTAGRVAALQYDRHDRHPQSRPAFEHSLELRVALPTESNHVTNDTTQLKAFYVTKWKWTGGSIAYSIRDALGATLYGSLNGVALSVTDTWGLGGHPQWRYRFEANATASF